MRLNAARDESKSSNKQHQHHNGVEEADGPEIDMEIGDDAGKDEEGAGDGKEPTNNASASPEENADAEEHWQQSNAEGVFTMKGPVRAHDRNLIDEQVSANAGHGETHDKITEAAGSSPSIAE